MNVLKAIYHYFVPPRVEQAEPEEQEEIIPEEPAPPVIENESDNSDEAFNTEIGIQRNERKKAKHEMKKKERRLKFHH